MSKSIFDLSGKVVLVTGGTGGLGREICEAMAEYGADVACVARTESKVKETAEQLSRFGHRAIGIKADAFEEADIKKMVATTVKKLGTIDIVFANAAILDIKPAKVHEISIENWDKVAGGNLRGVFLLMKEVFPIMMAKKSGNFISISAGTGMWPLPAIGGLHLATPYITAKTGIIMLTKLAARQYGEYGIRANIICPAYHRTTFHKSDLKAMTEIEKFVTSVTPLKRAGLAKDIKGLAVYLASEASSFVTGQTFVEDGGFMA